MNTQLAVIMDPCRSVLLDQGPEATIHNPQLVLASQASRPPRNLKRGITERDWENNMCLITTLYIERHWKLERVIEYMKTKHAFHAT